MGERRAGERIERSGLRFPLLLLLLSVLITAYEAVRLLDIGVPSSHIGGV